MKLKKFVLREGMNELHASELKLLKGGTDGLVATCSCECIGGKGYWITYTSHGKCDENKETSEWCEFGVICSQV